MAVPGLTAADRRGALAGILSGLVGVLLFLGIHAVLVTPIWDRWDAWARGLGVALVGGAAVGVLLVRVGSTLPGTGALRGALLGGLFAATLAPFLVGSTLRIAGYGPALWASAVAFFLLAAVAAIGFATRHSRALPAILVVALVLNAYPGIFLLSLPELLPDKTPDPLPQGLALMGIYVACGAILGALDARGRSPGTAAPIA